MAMEFSPNMGAGSKQFECKLCTFSRHFDARNGFLVQVKPAGKYVECWIVVFLIVLVCENWKKIPVCMCCIMYE